MIIYVLKSDAGEYLCYDRDYGNHYMYKLPRCAKQYICAKDATEDVQKYSSLGKFELYRWVITEEKAL